MEDLTLPCGIAVLNKKDTTSFRILNRILHSHTPWSPYQVIWVRAPQHIQRSNRKALEALGVPILESFPAQGWDINCVEHVWAQLQRSVSKRHPRIL